MGGYSKGGEQNSKSNAFGGLPQWAQDIMTGGAQGISPLLTTYLGDLTSMLQTGGSGAFTPIVGQAQEAQRRASSLALRDLDTQLAQQGLAGTPFGAATRAQTAMQGRSNVAGVPAQFAQQMLGQVPGFLGNLFGALFGALPGARETVSRSSGSGGGGTAVNIL